MVFIFMTADRLPELPLSEWRDTLETVHMWAQIVGKIANSQTPLINHFWNSTLRVTPRGLTTLPLGDGMNAFAIEFDFIDHQLRIKHESGDLRTVDLYPRTVADFYAAVMTALNQLKINVKIWTMPVELESPIRFTEDTKHASYDRVYVERFFKILVWTNSVFTEFRSRYLGKSSPVHFFWGSFDLAVTRFNGEKAPPREGADRVQQEAYSHECISHGFWPGGSWFGTEIPSPLYYAYAVPEPNGMRDQPLRPAAARFDPKLAEFVLPYDDVRTSANPRQALLEFLQSTYEAGANCGGWERGELE